MADLADFKVTPQTLEVLNYLLRQFDAEHHGFEIIKATGLKSGTLYPILARLESAGWVTSDWEANVVEGRPRRRNYRMTGLGIRAARPLVAGMNVHKDGTSLAPATRSWGLT